MIVSLAMCGSIFAQYETHWPQFYYPDFMFQAPCVAAIEIDGVIVTADNHPDNWNALEVAFFVGEDCRGAGRAFGTYTPTVNYLYNGYVEEYGDPFPIIDAAPVYYDNSGEEVTVKMYDHVNGIEYNECTITLEGAPYTILTGVDNDQGYWDPENPIILHFTTPAVEDCYKIVLDENNMWVEDFDTLTTAIENLTGVYPTCWTWTSLVSDEIDTIVEPDTMPQVYYNPAFAYESNYSLRMWHRGIYAMPELDEDINLNEMGMGFYVRQPFWFYTLQVGVMDDPTDPSTFVPVAYVDNGNSTDLEYFWFSFESYRGTGRYIAFKNVLPDFSYDVHSTNYIDHIVLHVINPEITSCEPMSPNDFGVILNESFEDYTTLRKPATGAEPRCWDVVLVDVDEEMTETSRPQIYYKPAYASDGNYSLRMVDRCVYAMRELDESVDMTTVQLAMSLRQPNKCYQLEVGVWDGENFEPVAVFNNPTTEITRVFCDFTNYTGNGHRIAFRNTLNSGAAYNYSYNYIDELGVQIHEEQECGFHSLPYGETFDYLTSSTMGATGTAPYCWEVVYDDVQPTEPANRPQAYYKPAFAGQETNYSLRMVDRCVYAMPEFEDADISQLQLSMYLRQPLNCYQLEVGVWEESVGQTPVAGGGTFVPVVTFNNADDAVTFVTCDFSNYTGNGGRIAFRNTLNSGAAYTYSYNYIDQVWVDNAAKSHSNSAESMVDEMGLDRYLESIAVYPNPTVGELHIGAVDVQKVECYNQMGQLVAVYNNESNISLNSLAEGVYTLRITVPQGVTMRKVVKR